LASNSLSAPAEVCNGGASRAVLAELAAGPQQWRTDLRRHGPHPRLGVAGRLGVSIAGLARGGGEEALTTEQIDQLRADPPQWLQEERKIHREVVAEDERVRRQGQEERGDRRARGQSAGGREWLGACGL